MTSPNSTPPNQDAQPSPSHGAPVAIAVECHVSQRPDGKCKAFADVHINISGEGSLQLRGFSVVDGKKGLFVLPPSKKGDSRYFPTLELAGPIRTRIEAAILQEYERMTKNL